MPFLTVLTGLLLIAAGVGGFAAAGFETRALTALIPAVFGVLIALCGGAAFRQERRKGMLRIATVLGIVGFLVPAGRLGMVIAKGTFELNLGTSMLIAASAICLLFVIASFRSKSK